jgi:hypothetical protein
VDVRKEPSGTYSPEYLEGVFSEAHILDPAWYGAPARLPPGLQFLRAGDYHNILYRCMKLRDLG